MRSEATGKEMEKAKRSSLLKSLGYTDEEMERPLIGVVCAEDEIMPGQNLGHIRRAVKAGILAAGGNPVRIFAPGISEVVSHTGMNYMLPGRELLADSIEAAAISYGFDAMVLIPGQDKAVSGMLMAAARVNIPAIVINGSPGDENDGMFMSCVAESLGMSLTGNGSIPVGSAERIRLARQTGFKIVELFKIGLRPRNIMTRNAFLNALAVDMALGGSADTVLHIPAIAYEAGVSINLYVVNDIAARTPVLCMRLPFGPSSPWDFYVAGGVAAIMKELVKLNLIKPEVITVEGISVKQIIERAENRNPQVIRSFERPYFPGGSGVILRGNLSPDGSIIRTLTADAKMMKHLGPARIFEKEEDAVSAIYGGKILKGDVVIIRMEGPKGGPGMTEMSRPAEALKERRLDKDVAIVTDGRFSGTVTGACIGHVSPEAAAGGNIALVEEGDIISIDVKGGRLEVLLSDVDLQKRREAFKPMRRKDPSGYLGRYAGMVQSAALGAVLKSN